MEKSKILVFDDETTGLEQRKCRLILWMDMRLFIAKYGTKYDIKKALGIYVLK